MTQIIYSLTELTPTIPTHLAIGTFDGVHRGHQQLIQQLIASAKNDHAQSAVLTFFPHPRAVVGQLPDRYYLTTLDERLERLVQLGVDLIILLSFDQLLSQMKTADFIDLLCRHLLLRQLWGGNFALGYQREGDEQFLRELGQEHGYSVHTATPSLYQDGRISSSRIRATLAQGAMEDVAAALGRPYALRGEVVYGRQLGRTIGVPTANVAVWEAQLLPRRGVYVTRCWVDGRSYWAATNVGLRPTVEGTLTEQVEAHLLAFNENLYGRTVRLEFLHFLRPEQKFPNLDALKQQIALDIAELNNFSAEFPDCTPP